jgi:hypothetical protein
MKIYWIIQFLQHASLFFCPLALELSALSFKTTRVFVERVILLDALLATALYRRSPVAVD